SAPSAATSAFYSLSLHDALPISLVVIGGVHLWIKRTLEERDEPRPWQFPTVLSTAMVAGIFVTLFPFFMRVDLSMPLPLVCLGLDRKSTRLNSSHVSISYAVFCL